MQDKNHNKKHQKSNMFYIANTCDQSSMKSI